MAKEEAVAVSKVDKPKPRVSLNLTEGEARGLGVGDTVRLTLVGTVCGVNKDSYVEGDKTMRVELEDFNVQQESGPEPLSRVREKLVKEHGEADEDGQ